MAETTITQYNINNQRDGDDKDGRAVDGNDEGKYIHFYDDWNQAAHSNALQYSWTS